MPHTAWLKRIYYILLFVYTKNVLYDLVADEFSYGFIGVFTSPASMCQYIYNIGITGCFLMHLAFDALQLRDWSVRSCSEYEACTKFAGIYPTLSNLDYTKAWWKLYVPLFIDVLLIALV